MSSARHLWRMTLVAGLLATLFEREALAARHLDVWCQGLFGEPAPWQKTLIVAQLLPGALAIRPDISDVLSPTSSSVLLAVTISAIAWSAAVYVAWRVIGHARHGNRTSGTSWRPWMTWALAGAFLVVGGWDVLLRTADLRSYGHCQRVLQAIPPGASRADVRSAIRGAGTVHGEIRDEDVFDPAAQRIDVHCLESYGVRQVVTRFHVQGDRVERVDRECATRLSCDVVGSWDCSSSDQWPLP